MKGATTEEEVQLDEAGYGHVTAHGSHGQVVSFLRRLAAQNHQELSQEKLEELARQHMKIPKSLEELRADLAAASSADDDAKAFVFVEPSEAMAAQALRTGGGVSGAAASSSGLAAEVLVDGSALCAENVQGDASNTLQIVAPPWGLQSYLLRSRMFQLVILHRGDPQRGLVISSSTDRSRLQALAEEILRQLGPAVASLGEAHTYQALQTQPDLLRRLMVSPQAVAEELHLPSAPSEEVHPEEEHGDCPICFDALAPGEAAMRCCGAGGQHHYFHARCLQSWVHSCRNGREATCPVCRGRLQMNGQRLQEFLNGSDSAGLSQDDRTFLESVSDGLRGKNRWSNMNRLERVAYAGGVMAAAGWGFMLGFAEERNRRGQSLSRALVLDVLPREHQMAQGIGYLVGLLARALRHSWQEQDRERRRNERSDRRPPS
ncbi:unnamed protein product [Effrenium voratum]|uniref:RING-type domain-containing protein n=1 Tax=Effrenium voratum TaxID=2562239 RepID=A0AA36N6W2_9DINO|nr:unnamed protein product [Effrenium voratum]